MHCRAANSPNIKTEVVCIYLNICIRGMLMVLLPLAFLAKSACDPKKRNFIQINDAILVFGFGFWFLVFSMSWAGPFPN